jgi:hypothetical protein
MQQFSTVSNTTEYYTTVFESDDQVGIPNLEFLAYAKISWNTRMIRSMQGSSRTPIQIRMIVLLCMLVFQENCLWKTLSVVLQTTTHMY